MLWVTPVVVAMAIGAAVVSARQAAHEPAHDTPAWTNGPPVPDAGVPAILGGDQVPDVVISPGSGGFATRVLDGVTLSELGGGFPFGPGFGGSVRTALGDVSGDGVADIVAAMGSGGSLVKLFDGATIAEIASGYPFGPAFAGGVSVAVADVNGDGREDVIVGQAGGGGTVRAFSGTDISLIFSRDPFGAAYRGGVHVAAGDVDGDGLADVIVGQATGGVVSVISGASHAVTVSGAPYGSFAGGVFVAAGDVNGDGLADVVVAPGSGARPVLVYDVATVTLLAGFVPYDGIAGGVRVAVGDVTSDGRVEILTVPGPGAAPELRVFDGATFGLVESLLVYPASYTSGNYVASRPSVPPRFTSAASTTFTVGTAGSFTIAAVGSPGVTSIAHTGTLPAGVTLTDAGDGTATLAGTPEPGSGGNYPITLSATNGIGAPVTQAFTLIVNEAPVFTSADATTFVVGVAGTFTVTSTGFPAPSVGAAGALPGGVTFTDNGDGTGTLAGTAAPGAAGVYPLALTADNGVGTPAGQSFALTVQPCTAVTLLPPAGALPGSVFGVPYEATFTATGGTGHVFSVTAGTLPGGLSLSAAGVLAGTPADTGSFAFTVTATNSIGCTDSNAYTLSVAPAAQDESFSNGVGNTQYSVGAGAPPTPAVVVSGSVLSNDGGPGTLTAGPASIATTQGGQVAMSTTGTFLYTPPVGFAGPSDSFTYTLTDGNGLTDTAVVTINLGGVVWYVDAAASAGDGRSHNPFNAMPAASTAAQAGHAIYLHQGSPAGATTLKTGQTLWGAGAAFTLNGLVIPATTAPTLQGTVTLADNVAVNSLSVNGGAGPAISASGLAGTELLNAVSVLGGSRGLDLDNLGGTLTVTGGSITGVASDADVMIAGGTGVVIIGASITNTGGRSVVVMNRTGGTVTFSGPITDTGTGILLDANTGSTISFTGGLTLSTGVNDAFTAKGGGTVAVTQDNVSVVNTIATTEGTALVVTNTEIGAAGMTFRSISAGTAAFSPGAGIILDNTGTAAGNGGLTVTGNGVAQSGGLIRRKSGADGALTEGVGIYLNATKDASFNWMELTRFDNSAIVGRNVSGFLLANSLVTDAGSTPGVSEGPIVFGLPNPGGVNGLQGTGTIRDSVISGGVEDNVAFYNQSGTMTLLLERTAPTPGACQIGFNSAVTGQHGLRLQMEGTAAVSATVNRCRFRDNRMAALTATAGDDASLTLIVTGSATEGLLKSEFVRQGQGTEGIVVANGGNASISATIENALINGFPSAAIRLGQATGNATDLSLLQATITGNWIESPATSTGAGIVGRFSSTIGEVSQARLLIAGNEPAAGSIDQLGLPPAIEISTPDAGTTPKVDLTIAENHVDMHEVPPGSGIHGPVGVSVLATEGALCANILNTVSHWYPLVEPQGGGIRLEQASNGTVSLERGSEPLATPAGMVLSANNPAPPSTTMVTEVLGAVTVVENGTCLVPTVP